MARACSICSHPQRAMIDRALAARQPLRRVARQYGVSKSALARHWTHHRQAASLEVGDFARDLAQANAQLARLLREITQQRGLMNVEATCAPRAVAAQSSRPLPAWPLACPDSTGPAEDEASTPVRQRVARIRPRYVPVWLPFHLEHEFIQQFHTAMQRAQEARGGRWRGRLDEVLTTGRILGGLHTTYKYGRTRSAWGRSMRGKRGQKALQHKLAMQGEQLSAYFAALGRRDGLAKARKRYQPYLAWQQDLAAAWPQQEQPKSFMEW